MDNSVVELAPDEFEERVLDPAGGAWLVDFWADWCSPCHQLSPILDDLARTSSHGVAIAKLDVGAAKDLADRFEIRSLPTMILFDGGVERHRLFGAKTRRHIEAALTVLGDAPELSD